MFFFVWIFFYEPKKSAAVTFVACFLFYMLVFRIHSFFLCHYLFSPFFLRVMGSLRWQRIFSSKFFKNDHSDALWLVEIMFYIKFDCFLENFCCNRFQMNEIRKVFIIVNLGGMLLSIFHFFFQFCDKKNASKYVVLLNIFLMTMVKQLFHLWR